MLSHHWITLGAVFAGLGVGLGAFAAHGLKSKLTPEMLAVFETGVRYQLVHALALFVVAWALDRYNASGFQQAGMAFVIGMLIFSGSLYVLSTTGTRWLGAITPIGGLALMTGWVLMAVTALKQS